MLVLRVIIILNFFHIRLLVVSIRQRNIAIRIKYYKWYLFDIHSMFKYVHWFIKFIQYMYNVLKHIQFRQSSFGLREKKKNSSIWMSVGDLMEKRLPKIIWFIWLNVIDDRRVWTFYRQTEMERSRNIRRTREDVHCEFRFMLLFVFGWAESVHGEWIVVFIKISSAMKLTWAFCFVL